MCASDSFGCVTGGWMCASGQLVLLLGAGSAPLVKQFCYKPDQCQWPISFATGGWMCANDAIGCATGAVTSHGQDVCV